MQQVVDGEKQKHRGIPANPFHFTLPIRRAILRAAQKHCVYFVLAPDTV